MVGRAAPTAIAPLGVREFQPRHPVEIRRSSAPASTDRLAPSQYVTRLAARQRPRPDAELVYGGEVSSRPPNIFSASLSPCRECLGENALAKRAFLDAQDGAVVVAVDDRDCKPSALC